MASSQRRRGSPKKKTAAATTKSESKRRRAVGIAADATSGRDVHGKRRRGEPETRTGGAKPSKARKKTTGKKAVAARTGAKRAARAPELRKTATTKREAAGARVAKKAPANAAASGAKRARARASAEELPGLRTAGPRPAAVSAAFAAADDARGVAEASNDETVRAWVRRGQELLELLAAHDCAGHEVRVDLETGRFVWLAPDGRVSAEAQAHVVCTWSPSNAGLVMGWADPLVRGVAIPRVDGMRPELDDVDEETAFRVAITAAEAASQGHRGEPAPNGAGRDADEAPPSPRAIGPEYLYRVSAAHAAFFLTLRDVRFRPELRSFTPGAPVGLVLRGLAEARQAISSGAEPATLVRDRLASLGATLRQQADSAYRDTDWVARLERTGKRLERLARSVARPSYGSIAAGRPVEEWISPELARELDGALALLEDEWVAFR